MTEIKKELYIIYKQNKKIKRKVENKRCGNSFIHLKELNWAQASGP